MMEVLNFHYNGICPLEKEIRYMTLNEHVGNDKLVLEDLKQQQLQLGSTVNIDVLSLCNEEGRHRSQVLHDGCLLRNYSSEEELYGSILDADREGENEIDSTITIKENDSLMSSSLVCDTQFKPKEELSIHTLDDKKYSSCIDSSDYSSLNTYEENDCDESYSETCNKSNEINNHKFMSIHPSMFSVQTRSSETIKFQDLQNLRQENDVLQQVTNKYKQIAMTAESELRELKAKITSYTLSQAIDTRGKQNLLTNRYHPYHKNAKRRLF